MLKLDCSIDLARSVVQTLFLHVKLTSYCFLVYCELKLIAIIIIHEPASLVCSVFQLDGETSSLLRLTFCRSGGGHINRVFAATVVAAAYGIRK